MPSVPSINSAPKQIGGMTFQGLSSYQQMIKPKKKKKGGEGRAEKQMRCLESQKLIQHFLFMHTKNDSLIHFFPKEARV